MQKEPDIYAGELDDFGTGLTNRFIHDAVKRYDYPWDENELRMLAGVSMFMATATNAAKTKPEDRNGHEHVLVKILAAIKDVEGAGT